ncbi:MAG TPA: response regulator transcription factor [Chloroflexia bacterium]|jgi:DNA-binding response OmpR family regulator|nr:response regulator transcription factor [Chloroflexia bacterium]
MAAILVVEDEAGLRDLIQLWLERAGYECHTAGSGRAALRLFYDTHPDLILLDLALPEMDGWQLCERIREVSQVPIIMVTARAEEPAKVRGLQMGADDYVTKPFGFPELLARVQAVLRRAAASRPEREVYHQGDLILDPQAHRAMLGGADLKLTPTEYRLLAFLMQHSGQLLTHRQILEGVWGPAYADDLDSLRIYIRNLRRKLEAGSGARYIATEHGLGYRFLKTAPAPPDLPGGVLSAEC